MILFVCSAALHAEDTGDSEPLFLQHTRYLQQTEIKVLPEGLTDKQLIERFGPSENGDTPMLFWPKAELKGQADDTTIWKKGYWFFFKRKEDGRFKKPLTLQFVASLPPNHTTKGKPLFELVPDMLIDWPESSRGKLLIAIY